MVRLDAEENLVVVGEKQHLLRSQVHLEGLVWSHGLKPHLCDGVRVECQIRYRQRAVPATLVACEQEATVEFDAPQAGVSPGQAAVFYRADVLIGGGWIC